MRFGEKSVACLFGVLLLLSALAPAQTAAGTAAPGNDLSTILQHIKFVSLEGANRYRYVDKNPGKVTDRDLQYKVSARVQVDVVGDGRTYLQARGESGRSNYSSYDYTGVGLNKGYWSYNLKSLSIGQRIGAHFELQAGGIDYDPGAGTEMTYADNDAWLEAYRLRYSGRSKIWMPNKIDATIGYAGDFTQPNAFARMNRMGDENYIQILGAKTLGEGREISAEFDSIQSTRFTREAVRWGRLPVVIVNDLTVETITRASDPLRFGWASTVSRSLDHKGRFRVGAFYSDLPLDIFKNGKTVIFQNGDTYVLGKRIGPTLRITPFKNLEISTLGTSRLDAASTPRYRGQFVVRYQFADLLNRVLR